MMEVLSYALSSPRMLAVEALGYCNLGFGVQGLRFKVLGSWNMIESKLPDF